MKTVTKKLQVAAQHTYARYHREKQMKALLLAVAIVAVILIRVLGFVPWTRNDAQGSGFYRKEFLITVGVISLLLILGWLWFVMRPR